jgi:hypothetical protein
MKLLTLIIFIFSASAAKAQPVVVTSGEHEDFSRLVFNFSKPSNWRLQREENGYLFIAQAVGASFDISQVYRRLSKNRVINVLQRRNPNGVFLELDCECYAAPFEFRPGMIVVDIKDGAAPPNSNFEMSGENIRQEPLKDRGTSPRQVSAGGSQKDNLSTLALSEAISSASRLSVVDKFNIPNRIEGPLDSIKEDLLWQVGRGAAAGLVDIVKILDAPVLQIKDRGVTNNFRISAEPGVNADSDTRISDTMTGEGRLCFTNEQLDIAHWFNESNSGTYQVKNPIDLVGEFDQPNLENVEKAIKFYLGFGFGAEARMLLKAFPVNNTNSKIWEAMSYILDLEYVDSKVFEGMETCDTAAAMWAILEKEPPLLPAQFATPAILRTFSALPSHLRRHLGPSLASRFISQNDYPTARAVRDATLRAPGQLESSLEMLDAVIDLAQGNIASANEALIPLSGSSGPVGIQATVALIALQVEKEQVVTMETSATAEALLHEARGGSDEGILAEALALAYASQDRFNDAFRMTRTNVSDSKPIWKLLAEQGSDSWILNYAVLDKQQKIPNLSQETKIGIAQRLFDLGFQDSASLWIKSTFDTSKPVGKVALILAAEIEFARLNYEAALLYTDQLDDSSLSKLREKILLAMDDRVAIEKIMGSERSTAVETITKRQDDWIKPSLLTEEPIWKEATRLTEDTQPEGAAQITTDQGSDPTQSQSQQPLSLSRALLEESLAARSTLKRFLSWDDISLDEN